MAEPTTSRRGQRLLHLGAALAAPALIVSGVLVSLRSQPAPSPQVAESLARPVPAVQATARARETGAAMPRQVVVPALGVRAAVTPIAAVDGALDPPADPRRVGWWSGGARPGSRTGTTVLTGHTVHAGGGAFDDLEQLQRGDRVHVVVDSRRLSYDVRSVRVMGRAQLARDNARVFRPTGPGRLVLITCEDWDGTVYRSNVVVTAEPAR
ncbi:class F sortase [Nocardioides sp. SYSU D00065]|uniref:class F sortase n=1 Tax=Nocardioides sp. SYSU D00065 TaxID=2817378 RepID=UPI0027DAB87C|nr:class F sortase [Nocardioides sp. SYSU D00065]